MFARTVDNGADSVFIVNFDEVKGVSGKYFLNVKKLNLQSFTVKKIGKSLGFM